MITTSGIRRSLLATTAALALGATGLGPAYAAAAPDWQTFQTNPMNCNGDMVSAQGQARRILIPDPTGGTFQVLQFHVAVDSWNGQPYVLNWQERYTSDASGSLYSSRQLVVSKGSEPNSLTTFEFTFSYDPPQWVFEATSVCLGAEGAGS